LADNNGARDKIHVCSLRGGKSIARKSHVSGAQGSIELNINSSLKLQQKQPTINQSERALYHLQTQAENQQRKVLELSQKCDLGDQYGGKKPCGGNTAFWLVH